MTETSTANQLELGETFRTDLMQLFRWRRDVRRFKPDDVPVSLVQNALEAANLSPSVGNSQPWRWVRIAQPKTRDAVVQNFTRANEAAQLIYDDEKRAHYNALKLEGLKTAPVQFAVFSDTQTNQGNGLGRQTMPETLIYSTVLSIHSFWLAARANGLGVGWVSILEPERLTDICKVAESWTFVAYLCVGWPLENHLEPELQRAGWQQRRALQIYDR